MANPTPPSGKKTSNTDRVLRVVLVLLGVYFCFYFALVSPRSLIPRGLIAWDAPAVSGADVRRSPSPASPSPQSPPPAPRVSAKQLFEDVSPHLVEADRRSRQAIRTALKPLDELFQQAKGRSRQFADDVVGSYSMFLAAADLVPGTSGDRLRRYVQQCFEERIFSAKGLEETIQRCITDYRRALEATDNVLLVRIQRDFDGRLADDQLGKFVDPTLLQREYEQIIRRMVSEAQGEAVRGVTDLVILEVINTLLIQAATRSGVTTAILGAGATSALSSGGVSLLVSAVIALIVDSIYDWVTDPAGKLADKLNASLDQVHRTLVQGDNDTPGLRAAMEEMARNRDELRKQVIRRLIVQEIRP